MNKNHPLVKRFGMFENKDVECFDKNNLFIKSGITVIAALSGEGKTTYILNETKKWEKNGFEVYHFNFDNAPTYDSNMIEPPVNSKDFKDFFDLLFESTSEKTIVVIDSLKALAAYMGKDILSNQEIYPIFMTLREISKKTKVSFILVHHVFKAKNVKTMPTSLYGSRAIEEQSDSAFIIEGDKARIVKNRAGHQRDKIVDFNIEEPALTKKMKDL